VAIPPKNVLILAHTTKQRGQNSVVYARTLRINAREILKKFSIFLFLPRPLPIGIVVPHNFQLSNSITAFLLGVASPLLVLLGRARVLIRVRLVNIAHALLLALALKHLRIHVVSHLQHLHSPRLLCGGCLCFRFSLLLLRYRVEFEFLAVVAEALLSHCLLVFHFLLLDHGPNFVGLSFRFVAQLLVKLVVSCDLFLCSLHFKLLVLARMLLAAPFLVELLVDILHVLTLFASALRCVFLCAFLRKLLLDFLHCGPFIDFTARPERHDAIFALQPRR